MNRLASVAAAAMFLSACGASEFELLDGQGELTAADLAFSQEELVKEERFSFPVDMEFPSQNPCNGNPITEHLVGEVRGTLLQTANLYRLVSIYDVGTTFTDEGKLFSGDIYERYTETQFKGHTLTHLHSTSHVRASDGSRIDYTIHFASHVEGDKVTVLVDRVDLKCPR